MKYEIVQLIIDYKVSTLYNNINLLKVINGHACIIDSHYNIWTLSHTIKPYHIEMLGLEWKLNPYIISDIDFNGNKRVQSLISPGLEFKDLIDREAMENFKLNKNTRYSYDRMYSYYKSYHKVIDSLVDKDTGN